MIWVSGVKIKAWKGSITPLGVSSVSLQELFDPVQAPTSFITSLICDMLLVAKQSQCLRSFLCMKHPCSSVPSYEVHVRLTTGAYPSTPIRELSANRR